MQKSQIIIEKLENNKLAQWLLFEMQNLTSHFNHPDGSDSLKLNSPYKKPHYMGDTIENLYAVICDITNIPAELADEGDTFDLMLNIDITTLNNRIFNS